MMSCWPTPSAPSCPGSAPFVDAALAANLEDPTLRAKLLWTGARALGLHPWHEDIQGLNLIQLHWATMQANPDRRQEIKTAKAEERNRAALELIAWHDRNCTT